MGTYDIIGGTPRSPDEFYCESMGENGICQDPKCWLFDPFSEGYCEHSDKRIALKIRMKKGKWVNIRRKKARLHDMLLMRFYFPSFDNWWDETFGNGE